MGGNPGAGGLDLVSLNIQRRRDHELARYNPVFASMVLSKTTSLTSIPKDFSMQDKLKALAGIVNNIDPSVAILAEYHFPGGNIGIASKKSHPVADPFFADLVY